MNINELRDLSSKHELSLNYISKDEKISELLLFFQDKDKMILKGGTAINRVYLKTINKLRFSEDIDFDYITGKDLKGAKQELMELMSRLKDFAVEKPRIMHQTIRFDTYFINQLGMRDRIMVEFRVNKKKNGETEKKIIDFGFVPAKSSLLQVYTLESLILFKLDTLLNRTSGKDVYDLFYLLDFDFKKSLVKKKISKGIKEQLVQRLNECITNYKTIQNSTNHYLVRSLRPDWRSMMLSLIEKINQI